MTDTQHKQVDWIFGRDGALFRAATKGDPCLARTLILSGANVNYISSNGYTPLHRAAENGNLELVTLLVDSGADVDAKTGTGETAAMLAQKSGHTEIAKMLEAPGKPV